MDPKGPVDIDRALRDPRKVFASPQSVVDHPHLSRDEKVRILQAWASRATNPALRDERVLPAEGKDVLETILEALGSLGAGPNWTERR